MVTLDHLLLPELTGKLSLKALCFMRISMMRLKRVNEIRNQPMRFHDPPLRDPSCTFVLGWMRVG